MQHHTGNVMRGRAPSSRLMFGHLAFIILCVLLNISDCVGFDEGVDGVIM